MLRKLFLKFILTFFSSELNINAVLMYLMKLENRQNVELTGFVCERFILYFPQRLINYASIVQSKNDTL